MASFVALLFISSLLLVDGMVAIKNGGKKFMMRYRDENYEDRPEFVRTNTVKRVMEERGDQEIRRNICLSARELDCKRELQDQ